MGTTWKLQDAKAKFSKLVDDALKLGPQFVTRRLDPSFIRLSLINSTC